MGYVILLIGPSLEAVKDGEGGCGSFIFFSSKMGFQKMFLDIAQTSPSYLLRIVI